MISITDKPVCDIVIPVWNGLEHTRKCIEQIIAHTRVPYRLIIIDNASAQETAEYLRGLEEQANLNITLIRNEKNIGFIKASNQGMRIGSSRYICLLNNDAYVTEDWLGRMIVLADKRPDFGIVNPVWRAETPENLESVLEDFKSQSEQYMEVNDCMGFCMLIKRAVIEKIGFLDEAFGTGGLEDSDYCKRAVFAGFRCLRAKDALVIHRENTSFNRIKGWEKERAFNKGIFLRRWGEKRQIVFIFDAFGEDDKLKQRLKYTLALSRLGLRAHIWLMLKSGSKIMDMQYLQAAGIPEHNNMKYFYFCCPDIQLLRIVYRAVFLFICFLKLVSRRRKSSVNRFKAVFLKNKRSRQLFHFLRPVHNAAVFSGPEECLLLRGEWDWIRSRE